MTRALSILGSLLAAVSALGCNDSVTPAADYTLSPTPATLTIVQGTTGSTTVEIRRTNFTGAVTLSLGGAPVGVVRSFNPSATTGTSATLMVGVGATVAPGVYHLTVDGTAAGGDRSSPLTVVVNASGVSDGVTIVGAGANHSCALKAPGQAYCWGFNAWGQLGEGTTTQRLVPTPVAGGLAFAALSVGANFACGVTSSGVVYCWGDNRYGELGDGTTTNRLVPTPVAGGLTFTGVSAGDSHTCGVTREGAGYCWGLNSRGQLGIGSNTGPEQCIFAGLTLDTLPCSHTPVAVVGALRFAVVSVGYSTHTCGITTSSTAYCWGGNSKGELGDSTTTYRPVPTPVVGGLAFTEVSPGLWWTCGVTTSGAAYCWGVNGWGELGDGTTTQRLVPTPVAARLTFMAVSSSDSHSCGVTTNAVAYCWGGNWHGQLGDGTTTDRYVPTAVGGGLGFIVVNAGESIPAGGHTCGVTTTGAAYCWGWNEHGELGDGTNTNSSVPVKVAGQP